MLTRVHRWLANAALISVLGLPLAAQERPDFRLELETGGHRAVIRALATDAAGRFVASASDDKTARIWDLSGASEPVVLRGFAGDGPDGVINAVALSPDGKFAAVAGYFGPHLSPDAEFGDVRIFDVGSRSIVRVLKGFPLVVDSLAYAPERDELAVTGQGGIVQRWQAPFSEAPERIGDLDSAALRVLHVAYAAGGTRLLAVSLDYGLRIWDSVSGAEIEAPEAEPLWDVPLTALAVSADGARFALAGEDGRVEIRASGDGAVLARLPLRPFRPDALAFVDQDRLIVGCGYRCGGVHEAEIWRLDPVELQGNYRDHDGPISALLALPSGAVVSAGGRALALHLWQPDIGKASRILRGSGTMVSAAGIAADGSWIGWGFDDPCPERTICPEALAPLSARLDLPVGDRGFGPPGQGDVAGALRAVLAAGDFRLSISDAPGGGFDGDLLTVTGPGSSAAIRRGAVDGYYHSAVTLLADGSAVSGGGNGALIAYGPDGRFAGEFVGHTGDILALAASETRARLLSASADQTLILWNLDTRAEIARFFFAGAEWVIWTPQGYYHSSPNGDRMIGWRINRGRDEAARYISASALKKHLHSPEIVRRAILIGDPTQAAVDLRGKDGELDALLTRAPPDFDLRLAEEIDIPEGLAVVEIKGASADEVEAWGYSILVNDRRVPPQRYPDPSGQGRQLYQIPLEPGENAIRVTGENNFGYVTERSAVALSSRRGPAPEKRGKLYVAAIGVADYPKLPVACNGTSCDLAYPVHDAVEMVATLAKTAGPLYSAIETLVLVSPSRLDGSEDLRRALANVMPIDQIQPPDNRVVEDALIEFLARPGPEDTTIVFVAGHGVTLGENYYLMPGDAEQRGGELRLRSLFDWQILQEELSYAKGRRLLLIDTCHAAGAFNARLEKDAADARIVVFSATAANNTAAERRDLGHGIFTYALLEGLRGKAATGSDGVRLLGLADYVYREVVRLSNARQEPYYSLLETSNFVVARP
ncbi:caspase family protein [Pseudooceanicola sp.]|uniref:caspase family protein n=1 Tax=Pseudooceanicola sp. TaxID=1914328 RepID=UPI002618EFF3|nr:caspase family protein [Pseudooceanicola sp.]MDF1856178.1 caspase family protein [Pseudooceanicola sp.]